LSTVFVIMAAMREAWTDERLDGRFNRLEDRFDSMQRMTLAAYLTAIVGLIVTQL
jgi:hypothetical protein